MENAGKTKALMLVAHPDDCVIFGFPFYSTHKQFEWTICYLTYKKWELRAHEISKFWNRRLVKTMFLGFTDDFTFVEKGITGFDNTAARNEILKIVDGFDLVLTHNIDGEYGHIHHIFVHNVIKETNIPQIYFAGFDNFNYQCVCQSNEYSLSELPVHRDVIEGFQDRLTGRYTVTESVRELI